MAVVGLVYRYLQSRFVGVVDPLLVQYYNPMICSLFGRFAVDFVVGKRYRLTSLSRVKNRATLLVRRRRQPPQMADVMLGRMVPDRVILRKRTHL